MWFVYILKCSDGSLYTGITDDLSKRIAQHNKGKASKYTRSRQPVELSYVEETETRSTALVREYKIKQLTRQQKKALIRGRAPNSDRIENCKN